MKLRVLADEIRTPDTMWAVSVSNCRSWARALFEDEGDARAYAATLKQSYANVAIVPVSMVER